MASAKWSDYSTESANIANTTLDSKANLSVSYIVDIDNTTNKNLYATAWMTLGSINSAVGGSVTLELRRKRGSIYANNFSRSQVQPVVSGSSIKEIEFNFQVPGPGIFGLYWTNTTGVTSAASGNAIYMQYYDEAVQ